jgi:hypothetical protein
MFDLQITTLPRTSVWLAARMSENKMLVEAARRRRRVHVWGVWQRGSARGCRFVNVTRVELEK